MENFSPVPRSNPPQPKSLNIEPPTYTVPDVTLMFDSDDSLIWKPGENPKAFLQRISNQQCSENVQHNTVKGKSPSAGLGKIETILSKLKDSQNTNVNPSQPASSFGCSPIVSTGPISSVLPISKSIKSEYNPQIYASPKAASTPLQTFEGFGSCNGNGQKSERKVEVSSASLTKSETSQVTQSWDTLRPPRVKTVSFQDNLVQNNNEIYFSSSSNTPPYRKQNENLSLSHDAHILKLIEGQNQQILYLHRVLEKVLEKLTTTSSHCKPCLHNDCQKCSCAKNDTQCEILKKVAIVQTSVAEDRPEIKTVATNTDVSWADIAPFFNDPEQRKEPSIYQETTNKTLKPSGVDKQSTPRPSTESKGSSHGSAKKETSLTLVGVNLETAYDDPPSPEPSLHLNVPEYEDRSRIERSVIGSQYGELEGEEFPLIGESALMYSERRRKEEKVIMEDELTRHPKEGQGVSAPELCVGTTFYNIALNNVQQILGETRREEYKEESAPKKEERHREDSLNPAQKGLSAYPLHPQQFGISFLDPATLIEKPRGGPVFDTFYLPAMLQGGSPHEDLEVLDGARRQRRFIASNYVSDNHLVAIARQSGSKRRPQMHLEVRRTKEICSAERERRENDFSFATKQFLGKYELDN